MLSMLSIARRNNVGFTALSHNLLSRTMGHSTFEGSIPMSIYKMEIDKTKSKALKIPKDHTLKPHVSKEALMVAIKNDKDLKAMFDSIGHKNKDLTLSCILKNLENVYLPSSRNTNASKNNSNDPIVEAMTLTYPGIFGSKRA